ncbi:RteC domain-containing protein [Flavobacterium chuncheonense]|uniref:RteC domain-containing protein n=1 Tax=Flavobacterium chuncheonense TaxID=2026653 RepID=A0ABW5YKU5_9FLAO
MKNFALKLNQELNKKLKQIHNQNSCELQLAKQAIITTQKTILELKKYCETYEFSSKSEEIDFFKNIKPQFISKLIYYNEMFNIEVNKPSTTKHQTKYYKKEIKKIEKFFIQNKESYKYYRTGETSLDKNFFIRKKFDITLTIENIQSCYDDNFNTTHDYTIAKIIAYETLLQYLSAKSNPNAKTNESKKKVKWTAPKVAFVELIYALHAEGVINNGKISLNELAQKMEQVFDIELSQHSRIFYEIRSRKTIQKTNFLNTLSDKLNYKMDQADG